VKHALQHIIKPVLFVIAAAYMLVDALFMTVAKPISDLVAQLRMLDRLRAWIVSLRPYPTLALFAVPVIILEPVKPVSAYLAATGHVAMAFTVLAVGEVLKLVLLQRLFSLSKDKLMSIAAFAWAFNKYHAGKTWLEATEAWQLVRRTGGIIRYAAYRFMMEMKALHKPRRQLSQMR
jgi:hypothetical protein